MNLTERYQEKLNMAKWESENLDNILLQLEVTNACNHRCIFCPNVDSRRKKTMIDYEFARRVMKECAEFLGNNKKICFHMNGEPLLYKRLPELVQYSKELGYDYSFITTNGSKATEELLEKLFVCGLDSIKFSINAGSRQTYKKIHGSDDFDNVIAAIKFSYAYRERTGLRYKIFVSCVGIKDNYDELTSLQQIVGKYCDELVFYYPCSYAGQEIERKNVLYQDLSDLGINTFEIIHSLPCAVLWNSINITCEGYLSLCCSESNNRLIIEDLNLKSVKEAWLGKKMETVRAKHIRGDIHDTPCNSCIYEREYSVDELDQELFQLSLSQNEDKMKNIGRLKNENVDLDYQKTKTFFDNRAEKYNADNPYSVTMYQDNNAELVRKRNEKEIKKLYPLLEINKNSKVLDLACGIGRWADAIEDNIIEYCGVDFSEELILIAKRRNRKNFASYYSGSVNDINDILKANGKGQYNVILMVGILMYLNDNDLGSLFTQIMDLCEDHTTICIREPLGIQERLTLKNFYSEELKDQYNAIYRTKEEIMYFLQRYYMCNGFHIKKEGYLFDDEALNNRKETVQYYFILER